jgi:hypothetical protein
MTRKEFPNNWQEIHDTPSSNFAECDYDQFMMFSDIWEINSSHCAIIRCENKETKKVTEYSYQRPHAVAKKIAQLCEDPDNIVIMAMDEAIYQLQARDPDSF